MKKATRRLVTLLLTLAMLLTLFAGCGTEQTRGNTDPSGIQSARTDIKLCVPSEITSMDPHATTAVADIQVYRQVYETLFFLNSKMELEPRVAERYELADDGMTYTFYLRQGAKFHNGDEVKASDVVFSFERAKTIPAMANYTAPIDTVTAVNDYTVQVKTVDVLAAALSQIDEICILSEKIVNEQGDKFGQSNVDAGCGPYTLSSYDRSIKAIYRLCPMYYSLSYFSAFEKYLMDILCHSTCSICEFMLFY